MSQQVYIGSHAMDNLQKTLHALSVKRIFLLRGKASYEACGAKALMKAICAAEGIAVETWCEFQENPRLEDLEQGLSLLSAAAPDAIVAVGGGSVLDMAKLLRLAYSYDGELTQDSFIQRRAHLPLLALPTTAGTGCETTPFAVCYKDGRKYSVAHDAIQPDYAFVYPPFTYRNSPYLTACTGFDAFAQAVEAYWSVGATAESDEYAKRALTVLWKDLPLVVAEHNPEARNRVAEAAYWAGKAIAITKTTAPHAYSYAFTTHCHYPHGHAVALTFPFFLYFNCTKATEENLRSPLELLSYTGKMKQLLAMLGLEHREVLPTMVNFIEKIGLRNEGYRGVDLRMLLAQVDQQRLGNSPVMLDVESQEELFAFLQQAARKYE